MTRHNIRTTGRDNWLNASEATRHDARARGKTTLARPRVLDARLIVRDAAIALPTCALTLWAAWSILP